MWATFIAIQIVGIDFGIILGVLVAIVSHVVSTVKVSSVTRVIKQSRAVWTPSDYKLLHDHGYHPTQPKIVTLEISGTVFFGSSLGLLGRISEELGLVIHEGDIADDVLLRSPHRSAYSLSTDQLDRRQSTPLHAATVPRRPPKCVVLDLTLVPNVDVSAARGCFLQLAKTCAKRDMIVCVAGANPKVEWMLRSHDVAYDAEEEARVEARLQTHDALTGGELKCERVLLFATDIEALEFCENVVIHELNSGKKLGKRPSFQRLDQFHGATESSVTALISHVLGLTPEERKVARTLEDERYYSEVTLRAGERLFDTGTYPNAFYIVLKGSIAVPMKGATKKRGDSSRNIFSGAGPVDHTGKRSALLDPKVELEGSLSSLWPVGSVVGYLDYMLERPRTFRALGGQDGTVVAKFTRSQMFLLQSEDTALDDIMLRLLLHASIMDLANCTCRESYVS